MPRALSRDARFVASDKSSDELNLAEPTVSGFSACEDSTESVEVGWLVLAKRALLVSC